MRREPNKKNTPLNRSEFVKFGLAQLIRRPTKGFSLYFTLHKIKYFDIYELTNDTSAFICQITHIYFCICIFILAFELKTLRFKYIFIFDAPQGDGSLVSKKINVLQKCASRPRFFDQIYLLNFDYIQFSMALHPNSQFKYAFILRLQPYVCSWH